MARFMSSTTKMGAGTCGDVTQLGLLGNRDITGSMGIVVRCKSAPTYTIKKVG